MNSTSHQRTNSLHYLVGIILCTSICFLISEVCYTTFRDIDTDISIPAHIPINTFTTTTSTSTSTTGTLPIIVNSSYTPIQLPDPLNIPRGVHLDPHTKYLIVAGWFGRFSNNLNMLRNALVLSKLLNRTLLFSMKSSQRFRIDQLFDWDAIRKLGYRIEFSQLYRKQLWKEELWPRARDLHVLAEFVEEYEHSPQQLLLLHSYTAFYQCIPRDIAEELWRAFIPSQRYREALDDLKRDHLGLEEGEEYVGVHLRKMEHECYRMAHSHFNPLHVSQLTDMCVINWTIVEKGASLLGTSVQGEQGMKVFIASDGQDKDRDGAMKRHGAMVIDWDTFNWQERGLFPPALDYFMLWESNTYIGSSISSFSSSVAEIRVSKSGVNRNVMSIPPVIEGFSVEGFWECERYRFWCAKQRLGRHAIC